MVIPLIENCKYEIIDNKYLENQGNYNTMRTIIEDADNVYPPGAAQLLRCPYAWYKKINYETGEINLNAYPNAEFVVSANTKAAHCGGMEDSATVINGIVTLEARSCNQKADTEIRVISLG